MPLPEAPPSSPAIRPFLKWAGGKRQLLPELRRFVPSRFAVYHEPFLGSGAVFFDLRRRGLLAEHRCRLADTNADLVGCYTALAHEPSAVVHALRALAAEHARDGADAYYRVRDERFNPARARRASTTGARYPADLAAMFIYLNRTGYNGLFRLNAQGEYNVPAGRYAKPTICDEATLRAAGAVLADPAVEIRNAPFSSVADVVREGDFVYFDPPYAPLSATARFTAYTAASFTAEDQLRLQQLVLRLARAGVFVVLSNSVSPVVVDLYDNAEARRAGLRTYRVAARRAINSNAGRRGEIEELIVSNVTRDKG